MRPPLAQDRLQALAGDRYRYEFRRPWRDGTVAIELSGHELIEKLVAITPAPRANLVRYHGPLAPNARLRSAIVPRSPDREDGKTGPSAVAYVSVGGEESRDPDLITRPHGWAELMRRVVERDVLECARCKGRLTQIATITKAEVIRSILECIGLPVRLPPLAPLAPARSLIPPELDRGAP